MSKGDKRRSTSLWRRSPSREKEKGSHKPTMRSTMPTAFGTGQYRQSSLRKSQNRRNSGSQARMTKMPRMNRIGGINKKKKTARTGGNKTSRTMTKGRRTAIRHGAKDPPMRSCSRREKEKNDSTPSCRGHKKWNRDRPTDRREKRAEGLSGPTTDGNSTEPGPRVR